MDRQRQPPRHFASLPPILRRFCPICRCSVVSRRPWRARVKTRELGRPMLQGSEAHGSSYWHRSAGDMGQAVLQQHHLAGNDHHPRSHPPRFRVQTYGVRFQPVLAVAPCRCCSHWDRLAMQMITRRSRRSGSRLESVSAAADALQVVRVLLRLPPASLLIPRHATSVCGDIWPRRRRQRYTHHRYRKSRNPCIVRVANFGAAMIATAPASHAPAA